MEEKIWTRIMGLASLISATGITIPTVIEWGRNMDWYKFIVWLIFIVSSTLFIQGKYKQTKIKGQKALSDLEEKYKKALSELESRIFGNDERSLQSRFFELYKKEGENRAGQYEALSVRINKLELPSK